MKIYGKSVSFKNIFSALRFCVLIVLFFFSNCKSFKHPEQLPVHFSAFCYLRDPNAQPKCRQNSMIHSVYLDICLSVPSVSSINRFCGIYMYYWIFAFSLIHQSFLRFLILTNHNPKYIYANSIGSS